MAKFKSGCSGNPAGRPKGTQDKRTALRELLAPHATDLIGKAVELAKDGDTTALRLCLERILPAMRANDEVVELGQITGTLADRGHAIVDAGLGKDYTESGLDTHAGLNGASPGGRSR